MRLPESMAFINRITRARGSEEAQGIWGKPILPGNNRPRNLVLAMRDKIEREDEEQDEDPARPS